MKIYIETDMTEMPKGGKECRRYRHAHYNSGLEEYICQAEDVLMEREYNSRPSWCPLREIDALPEIIHEMAEAQTLEKTLKVHTDKLTAEFQLKLVSVEFKEEKE